MNICISFPPSSTSIIDCIIFKVHDQVQTLTQSYLFTAKASYFAARFFLDR